MSLNMYIMVYVITLSVVSLYYAKKIPTQKEFSGRAGNVGWFDYNVACSIIFCIVGVLMIKFNLIVADFDGVVDDFIKQFLMIQIFVWCGTTLGLAAFISGMLDKYTSYHKWCLRLGVDTNKYIGTFFVMVDANEFCKNKSVNVNIGKVVPLYSWLGDFSEIAKVSNIGKLVLKDLSKENIKQMVDGFMDSRKVYMVKDDTITEQEDNITVIYRG